MKTKNLLPTVVASLLLSSAIGLALAPAASAYSGVEQLVLARDACGGKNDAGDAVDGPDNPHLAWNTSGATNCGSTIAGLDPVLGPTPDDYPSDADTGPVVLDDSRQIEVDIKVEAFFPLKGGLGDETIDLDLTGRSATNKTVDFGGGTSTKAAQDEILGGNYTQKFMLNIPAGKGGTYKSFNLSLSVGGAELGGFVMTDGGSFVSLPIQSDEDAGPPDTGDEE